MSEPYVAAAAVTAAALVATAPVRSVPRGRGRPPAAVRAAAPGVRRRGVFRPLSAIGAGVAAALFLGGLGGAVAGVATAAGAWWVLARAEPPEVARRRQEAGDDLPHLVGLFAATLRAGQDPVAGLSAACRALPGAAADQLAPVVARAALGERQEAWRSLADDPTLGRLGRTLARAQETGSPVTLAVERLAEDLLDDLATLAEDRARRVGVLAALPLGVCLLPAFMLLGIVPTVAAMLGALTG